MRQTAEAQDRLKLTKSVYLCHTEALRDFIGMYIS